MILVIYRSTCLILLLTLVGSVASKKDVADLHKQIQTLEQQTQALKDELKEEVYYFDGRQQRIEKVEKGQKVAILHYGSDGKPYIWGYKDYGPIGKPHVWDVWDYSACGELRWDKKDDTKKPEPKK
jgi:hypothetical protein